MTTKLSSVLLHLWVAALSFLCGLPMTRAQVDKTSFYRTSGIHLVSPGANETVFIARGMNLASWAPFHLESYALQLNGKHKRHLNAQSDVTERIATMWQNDEQAMQLFWGAFHNNWVTMQDFVDLSDMGFNAIRLPFNYRLVSPQATPGVYSEEGFAMLDKVIDWCRAANLALLLDMHACPGGQSHDAYADPEYSYWNHDEASDTWYERGVQVLWEFNEDYFRNTGRTPEFNQQRTADIWRTIAERYRDEPIILGYELANEPYYYASANITDMDLRNFFIQVTSAIRQVDTNHIVFVEGNIFAEMIGGLLPKFDDNMAVAFHRYWRETGYEDGVVEEYLHAREEYNVPFLMTESGENSNPWIYEIVQLMKNHDIGWFFWGYKKVVGSLAVYCEVQVSDDYRFVIDNFRDSEPDSSQVQRGLMELTDAMKTENCVIRPGFLAAMVDPDFNMTSKPYTYTAVPGYVYAVHYDVGNQGIAYSDTRYKNEEYQGEGWNLGWTFRNDGVDIAPAQDEDDQNSIGFHIFETEASEWLKYTVDVVQAGSYSVEFRVAGSGALRLLSGETDLTDDILISDISGGWVTVRVEDHFYLERGTQTLMVEILEGGVDFSWMNFELLAESPTAMPSALPTTADSSTATSWSLPFVVWALCPWWLFLHW